MKAGQPSQVGNALPRVGGRERVTGSLRYAADIKLDGALQARLVQIPAGHARVLSVDTAAAGRVDGVRCVLTAAGLPQPVPRFGPAFQDRPLMAVEEVKFFGEPVAIVAAEDEDSALEAARLVQVAYEELPGVYTVEDALRPDAPLVQDPALRGEFAAGPDQYPARVALRMGRGRFCLGRPGRRKYLYLPDGLAFFH